MRRADRLRHHFLRGHSQGSAKVIHTRRRQRFRRVSFRPGGGPPLLGRFAAMPPPSVPLFVSPPWRLCAAFSFSGCKFTRLYFSFVLRHSCGVACRLRLACVGVWRLPWPSVGRSCTGWACISSRRCSGLVALGAAVAVRVQAWPEAVRVCPAWAGRFFAGVALIAPPGLPGGCVCLRQSRCGKVAKSKVDEGAPESRCSQVLPHSRYSR